MSDTREEAPALSRAIYDAMDNGILILVNVKNHRVTYSIVNRPDPTLTPVSDHMLATALVEAGSKFKFKKVKLSPLGKFVRADGEEVVYTHSIDIDWSERLIESTMRTKLTKQVLSIVIQNLMSAAQSAARDPHGPRPFRPHSNRLRRRVHCPLAQWRQKL